jgi:probable addiction module antidote protein
LSKNKYDYKADLLNRLKELQYAELYLEAAARESQETFLLALRDVVEAQKGMAQLAVEADVNRENLYRVLSEEGNPTLNTLTSVLSALGIEWTVRLKQAAVFGSSEPSTETTESKESASPHIDLNAGNVLQLASSNNILPLDFAALGASGANNSQDEQDAAMETLPSPYMIRDIVAEYEPQIQLAGRD